MRRFWNEGLFRMIEHHCLLMCQWMLSKWVMTGRELELEVD